MTKTCYDGSENFGHSKYFSSSFLMMERVLASQKDEDATEFRGRSKLDNQSCKAGARITI